MSERYLIKNRLAYWAFRLADAAFALLSLGRKRNFAIPRPKKIVLSNIAHLGDVVLMTALFPVIKRAFPEVKIGVIVGSWSRKMVESHPLVDYVHVLDHWKVARSSSSRFQKMKKTLEMAKIVKRELRQIQYDISVECSFHYPNTIFLTSQAGVPVRIGYTSGGFGPLLTHPVEWTDRNVSVAVYSLDLVKKFASVEVADLRPVLPEGMISIPMSERYIVIHMGSGNPIKEWPIEKWKELCAKLVEDGRSLVFTGKGEKEAEAIAHASGGLKNCSNLCNLLAWEECIPLIRGAQMLIGVDTGLGHVAAATETPSVLIYAGIHPIELWRPLSSKVHVLIHPVPCHPCRLTRGCESMACIRNVSVESVYEAANGVLLQIQDDR